MHRLIPLLVLLSSCAAQQTPHLVSAPTVTGHAVVASVSADASKVGARVMFEGGNAVDGAVATAYEVFDPVKGAPRRSSYVVDREGRLRWAVHNANPDGRDLQEHLRELHAAVS